MAPETALLPPPKDTDPRLYAVPGRSLRLTTLVLAGGLTMAIFGSRAVLQDVQSQPDMVFYATIESSVAAWHRAMQAIAATAPDHALQGAVHWAEGLTFRPAK